MRLKRNAVSLAKLFIILFPIVSVFSFIYILTRDKQSFQKIISSKEDKVDWHNYEEISNELKRHGPGEQGAAVVLPPIDDNNITDIFSKNGFNAFASDMMALNRSLRDIRHPNCRTQRYQALLPTVSIIIPFYEEHWSTLLRTFISSINRAPPGIIKEVILVDDGSTKTFLKDDLDNFISQHYKGFVKVIRNSKRKGLITSKLVGARNATSDVLIFLDSHCEANINWLPPLLDPIARDYRTVVCPFIDILDFDNFQYRAQDEGARGAFDWEFNYKRLPLLHEDSIHPERPFKSPVMAGGLFAISRKWFWELGGYDPGLDIWGGEQYELSFKIWQCGGQMVDAPCSRIGHVYRRYPPFSSPTDIGNYIPRNYKRVAEVWMDEYKEFLYQRSPLLSREKTGDLSAQIALRKRLHCKSFKWFMKKVAFDLEEFYPSVILPNAAQGKIQSNVTNSKGKDLCLFGKSRNKLILAPCFNNSNAQISDQSFMMTWREDIRLLDNDNCLDVADNYEKAPVILYNCHGMKGNQLWKYVVDKKQLYHENTKKCLTADPYINDVYMEICKNVSNQQWILENLNIEVLDKYEQKKLDVYSPL